VSAPTRTVLALDGEITIHGAADLKSTLLAALGSDESEGEIAIDVSGVSELDTAGLQLLLMLKLQADQLGRTLLLVDPSAAVTEVLSLVRLDLRLDQVIDPAVIGRQPFEQNGDVQ
jgi:anti-sigma B factor antagonist